tara:strand:+ start:290 stop:439 length:150 start_codon:yes stop_codon:yes gene_type:complete
MFTWAANIRMAGSHDFIATIRAPDQTTARKIFWSMYGKKSVIGDCVWRV